MAEPKQEDDNHINIKVVSQDHNEVLFKISKTTPMKKMMDAYCKKQGIMPTSVRFLFNGERLREGDTPQSLQMENNDIIDAMLQQIGGY